MLCCLIHVCFCDMNNMHDVMLLKLLCYNMYIYCNSWFMDLEIKWLCRGYFCWFFCRIRDPEAITTVIIDKALIVTPLSPIGGHLCRHDRKRWMTSHPSQLKTNNVGWRVTLVGHYKGTIIMDMTTRPSPWLFKPFCVCEKPKSWRGYVPPMINVLWLILQLICSYAWILQSICSAWY